MSRFNKFHLSAILIYLYGSWYFVLRILGYSFEFLPGDLGDSRFINYILEHGYRFLTGREGSFWSAPFMYPYPNAVALSDNLLGSLPAYSLFRGLGISVCLSYQLWWITLVSANFWACYWVLMKWFRMYHLSALIAFVFAFGVCNISQLNYTQVMAKFCIPINIYAAYLLFSRPSIKYLLLYCISLVWQFYLAMYFGFFLFYFSLIFLGILSIVHKNVSWFQFYLSKKQLVKSLPILVFSILALLVLFLPYFSSVNDVGLKLYKDTVPLLPEIPSYFFAHDALSSYSFLTQHGKTANTSWWLQSIFPGLITYLGYLIFPFLLLYWKLKKQPVDILMFCLFLTCSALLLLFTRFGDTFTLYFTIFKLPGLNSLKVLTRFMHVEVFFMLVLSLLVLNRFPYKNVTTFIVLVLFVLADNRFDPLKVTRISKEKAEIRTAKIAGLLSAHDLKQYDAVVGFSGYEEPPAFKHLDMMLGSQRAGIPCVNGYSSSCKDEFRSFFLHCDSLGMKSWLDYNKINLKRILVLK